MPANAVGSDVGFPLFEIRRFDPATETGPLETQTVAVTEMKQSPNTYPEVERGIRETMARYYPGSLTETTVNLFSRMSLNTGPFTKNATYKGRSITINVKILHRDLYRNDNAAMKMTFPNEMRTQDLVLFNGHAGPYYAWYLGAAATAVLLKGRCVPTPTFMASVPAPTRFAKAASGSDRAYPGSCTAGVTLAV